jgi:hypothetical protein
MEAFTVGQNNVKTVLAFSLDARRQMLLTLIILFLGFTYGSEFALNFTFIERTIVIINIRGYATRFNKLHIPMAHAHIHLISLNWHKYLLHILLAPCALLLEAIPIFY